MGKDTERTTIYFETEIHKALRMKSAVMRRPISDIVNEAVRGLLREDRDDLQAFEERASELEITYEELLAELRANGTL